MFLSQLFIIRTTVLGKLWPGGKASETGVGTPVGFLHLLYFPTLFQREGLCECFANCWARLQGMQLYKHSSSVSVCSSENWELFMWIALLFFDSLDIIMLKKSSKMQICFVHNEVASTEAFPTRLNALDCSLAFRAALFLPAVVLFHDTAFWNCYFTL